VDYAWNANILQAGSDLRFLSRGMKCDRGGACPSFFLDDGTSIDLAAFY
jgi:hypothetical protein